MNSYDITCPVHTKRPLGVFPFSKPLLSEKVYIVEPESRARHIETVELLSPEVLERRDLAGNFRCSRCQAVKPSTEFYRDPSRCTGVTAYCKDCKLDHLRECRERKANGEPPPVKPKKERQHGEYSTYTRGGCRCDVCTQAASAYVRAYRKRLGGAA